MLDKFTSTGIKLINYPRAIELFQSRKIPSLISLQVSLTSKCNLNCVFCSNADRTKNEQLDFVKFINLIDSVKSFGLKTVEFTGGGDPTLHPDFETAVAHCYTNGLHVGLITNGLTLSNFSFSFLFNLSWIRVSLNGLDYDKAPKIPTGLSNLGFSYVVNEKTNENVLKEVKSMIKIYNPKFVRVVPDCLSTHTEEEIQENHNKAEEVSKFLGISSFFQGKQHNTPKICYWSYFKPFVNHDGFVYPCSSVVLNTSSQKKFADHFRMCEVKDLHKFYKSEVKGFDTSNCDRCVFFNQNKLLSNILNPSEDDWFI